MVIATKKGVNTLERGSQVHVMAEFQELLDFPPAEAERAKASSTREGAASELRGQEIFFGKGTVRGVPPGAVLYRQPDAQSAGGALLQAG